MTLSEIATDETRFSADERPDFTRDYGREVYGYYGLNYPY